MTSVSSRFVGSTCMFCHSPSNPTCTLIASPCGTDNDFFHHKCFTEYCLNSPTVLPRLSFPVFSKHQIDCPNCSIRIEYIIDYPSTKTLSNEVIHSLQSISNYMTPKWRLALGYIGVLMVTLLLYAVVRIFFYTNHGQSSTLVLFLFWVSYSTSFIPCPSIVREITQSFPIFIHPSTGVFYRTDAHTFFTLLHSSAWTGVGIVMIFFSELMSMSEKHQFPTFWTIVFDFIFVTIRASILFYQIFRQWVEFNTIVRISGVSYINP